MRILLTGGSACGKSTYAETLATRLDSELYYIAAMKPYDDEAYAKIARHREMRSGKGFETIERYTDMAGIVLPKKVTVLLECICNLTANEMFDSTGAITDPYEAVIAGVNALANQCNNTIVVTNDVGSDNGAYEPETRRYIEVLGRINRKLATDFDCVIEMVCGIPIVLKGELPCL